MHIIREILSKRFSFVATAVLIAIIAGSMCGFWSAMGDVDYTYTLSDEADDLSKIEVDKLTKGVYSISVLYNTISNDGYGTATVDCDDNSLTHALDSDVVLLPYYQNMTEYPLYINKAIEGVSFSYSGVSEDNPLIVSHMSLHKKKGASFFYFAWNIFWIILLILCVPYFFWYIVNYCNKENKIKHLGLFAILFFIMLPVMNDFLPGGVDLEIHLNRLEGMALGLKNGMFPVRMHSNLWNGHGYPFGVFYGDILYYISAILYMLGLPLWRAYRVYVVFINLITVYISYYCFFEIGKKTKYPTYVGLFGCAIYCLNIWHVMAVYERAAVGAYTAYAFIPLAVLGILQLIGEDELDKKKIRLVFFSLVAGFAGIAVSHMLTLMIVGLFTAIIVLVYCRRLLAERFLRMRILCVSGIVTIVTSLGFLYPVFYMTHVHDLYISNFTFHLQQYGIYLPQLFLTNYNTNGLAFPIQAVGDDWPQTMGLALIASMMFAIYIIVVGKKTKNTAVLRMGCILSCLAVYMSTYMFPYDFIQERIPWLYSIFGRVQTSNRYLLAAVVLMTVISIYVLMHLLSEESTIKVYIYCGVIIGLLCWQGITYFSDYYMNASIVDPISNDDAGVLSYSDDYLYLFNDVDYSDVYSSNVVKTDNVTLESEAREGNSYQIIVSGVQEGGGYVEYPIYNYVGYFVTDGDGNSLQILDSENHMVQLYLEEGYSGLLELKYKEPFSWRLSEIVSLIGLLGVLCYYFISKRGLIMSAEALEGD